MVDALIYIMYFRVGPLIASWCMRMEAKNSYFKKVARVGNFQNIAYSVAKRHQRLMCAYLQNSRFFTYDDLQCGPCTLNKIINDIVYIYSKCMLHNASMYVYRYII